MRTEPRRHSWIIVAGAVSGIVLLLLLFSPFLHMAWLFLQGYDVHIH